MAQLKSNFVPVKEFEYKIEELKVKISDDKDYQAQYNDGIQDKFEIVFNKFEILTDDKVSNEKLDSELEKYTRLSRFIRVEEV